MIYKMTIHNILCESNEFQNSMHDRITILLK